MSNNKKESYFNNIENFKLALNESRILEEELRHRSNSCIIPSFEALASCLDFVPKLK